MRFKILDTTTTNNFNDPDIQNKLKQLWVQNNKILTQLAEKKRVIACVYYNYISNYKGNYSVTLCREDDMDFDFDTMQYNWRIYKVDTADPIGVINTWKKVWDDEEHGIIKKIYGFDYEQYNLNGNDVTIHIAIQ